MPGLVDSLSSLVSSVFHTFTAALGSVLAVIQSLLNAILSVIQTAFAAVGGMLSGLAQTFEGLTKFLLSKFQPSQNDSARRRLTYEQGNLVVIGGLVVAFFVYSVYQQRNGRPITAAPAKQKKIN
jgi:uncharacterized membrane-anchored protein